MTSRRNVEILDHSPSPDGEVPDYVHQLERVANYLPAEQLPLLRREVAG